MKRNYIYTVITVTFTVLFFELILRLLGVSATYSEKTLGFFTTYYNQVSTNLYHTWKPNTEIRYFQEEFQYVRHTNSEGFIEKEFPESPSDSFDYIFVLGDSFTEGDGAPMDSNVTSFLEAIFWEKGFKNVRVFNAGTSGSDAAFNFKVLQDKLLDLNPKLIICINNESDVEDFVTRGGEERFSEDGVMKTKEAPFGFIFYRYSIFARLFFHAIGYEEGMMPRHEGEERSIFKKQVADVLIKIHNLCKENDIESIFIGQAYPNLQLEEEEKYVNTSNYVNFLGEYFDEKAPDLKYLNSAPLIKPLLLSKPKYYYSWQINAHFNSKGYKLFADVIYDGMKNQYPEVFEIFKKEKNIEIK